MATVHVKAVATAWTWRKEIAYVGAALLALILLPLLALVGLLTNGVQGASDQLVEVNPVTHKVDVKTYDGKLIASIDATTSWPIKGTVTQEFGDPNPPYQAAHSGIDIDGGRGAPITTFMAGKVVGVGDLMPGCGTCVMVDHGFTITSLYAHLSEARVSVGQDVKPGDILGLEGETGWAHGAHLHFEIRINKIPVNPRIFMVGNPPPRS